MKKLKIFTDGVAICLAILAAIYVAVTYLAFDFKKYEEKYTEDYIAEKEESDAELPEEDREEIPSKLEYFFDNAPRCEDYFYLTILLALSGALGLLLRRFPTVCLLLSAMPICYALTLFDTERLVKYPMTVITLSLAHAAGALIYATTEDRRRGSICAPAGGLICGAAAGACCIYTVYLQNIVASTAGYAHYLSENSINLPTTLRAVRNVTEMIYNAFIRGDVDAANRMLDKFTDDIAENRTAELIYSTLNTAETADYKRIALIIFAAIVICFIFILRDKRSAAALVGTVPTAYLFLLLVLGKFSTLTLPIILLSLIMTVSIFAWRDARKKAPVSEIERAEYLEYLAQKEDESFPAFDPKKDEIFYN
jgi:hypothetical protein